MKTVVVTLAITAEVEITDAGYLGWDAKVQEHVDRAKGDASHWQVLIKRGGLDPVRVPAKMVVDRVTIMDKP